MPTAKAAIDARTDTMRGAGLPAIPIPRNATFPVMNAVKTFPNPRKLIESIAPDERVRASKSPLRTPTLLTRRSILPVVVVMLLISLIPFSLLLLFGYTCSTATPLLPFRDTALRVQIREVAALSACRRIDDAVDQCRFA